MTDRLTLDAGDARVVLAPAVGGAIEQFTFRAADVMRPTPAEARAARNARGYSCYPLVPYSNRIANARLAFDGGMLDLARNFGEHPHSIHGVGWQKAWSVVNRDERSALIAIEHGTSQEEAAAWPWPFRATQSFALAAHDGGATLTAKISIANTGASAFPFGLGFHPFFPRTASTLLGFRATHVWETESTQLPTQRIAVPDGWRFDPPRAVGDVVLDNVFVGWDGRATLRDPQARHEIVLSADRAAPFLVVYVPAGREFLAIEPVTHMTDAFNRAARGETDTGTRVVEAGAGFSCTMRIFVRATG